MDGAEGSLREDEGAVGQSWLCFQLCESEPAHGRPSGASPVQSNDRQAPLQRSSSLCTRSFATSDRQHHFLAKLWSTTGREVHPRAAQQSTLWRPIFLEPVSARQVLFKPRVLMQRRERALTRAPRPLHVKKLWWALGAVTGRCSLSLRAEACSFASTYKRSRPHLLQSKLQTCEHSGSAPAVGARPRFFTFQRTTCPGIDALRLSGTRSVLHTPHSARVWQSARMMVLTNSWTLIHFSFGSCMRAGASFANSLPFIAQKSKSSLCKLGALRSAIESAFSSSPKSLWFKVSVINCGHDARTAARLTPPV
eukprot:3743894-Rhodomonas_salina.1